MSIQRCWERGKWRSACDGDEVLLLDALEDLRRRQRAIAGPQDQQHALSHFRAEDASWDVTWMCQELGETVALQGGDPTQLWAEAADGADADGDTVLLADIERALAGRLLSAGDLEGRSRITGVRVSTP